MSSTALVLMTESYSQYKVQEISISSIRHVLNLWKAMKTGLTFKISLILTILSSNHNIKIKQCQWKMFLSKTSLGSCNVRRDGSVLSTQCGGEWNLTNQDVMLEYI